MDVKITYKATEEIICSIYRPCVSDDYPLGMMEEHLGPDSTFFGCLGDPPSTFSRCFSRLDFEQRFDGAMMHHRDWSEIRARRLRAA